MAIYLESIEQVRFFCPECDTRIGSPESIMTSIKKYEDTQLEIIELKRKAKAAEDLQRNIAETYKNQASDLQRKLDV